MRSCKAGLDVKVVELVTFGKLIGNAGINDCKAMPTSKGIQNIDDPCCLPSGQHMITFRHNMLLWIAVFCLSYTPPTEILRSC